MKNNKKIITAISGIMLSGLILAGCASQGAESTGSSQKAETSSSQVVTEKTKKESKEETKGEKLTKILSETNWQGTKVYDKNNQDVTEENSDFIGLAKYDAETGYYEFFDKETGETRGDEGTFFVTADGEKRILISKTKNYQAVVGITELTPEKFTYKRMGKDKDGKETEVFVEHVPYKEKELAFTTGREPLTSKTGEIETKTPGATILGEKLWNGTKVLTESGEDVTAENQMFISLAKFDDTNSKYEFFDLKNGETRGDFGFYDVLDHNKIRAHVSIGENKYGAVLEITEINEKKFTYKRLGKDKEGQEIPVFVEHEAYTGDFTPSFTF